MTEKSKFVLKLSGIDLDNIKATDIGRLLNKFCKLLGDEHIFFDAIYSGSAVLKVSTEPEHYNEKLDKLSTNIHRQAPALEDINKVFHLNHNHQYLLVFMLHLLFSFPLFLMLPATFILLYQLLVSLFKLVNFLN